MACSDAFAGILAEQLLPLQASITDMQELLVRLTDAFPAKECREALADGADYPIAQARTCFDVDALSWPYDITDEVKREFREGDTVALKGLFDHEDVCRGAPGDLAVVITEGNCAKVEAACDSSGNDESDSDGLHAACKAFKQPRQDAAGRSAPSATSAELSIKDVVRGAPRVRHSCIHTWCVWLYEAATELMAVAKEPRRRGRLNALITSNVFHNVSSTIICVNTIFVAYQSDWLMKNIDSPPQATHEAFELAFFAWYAVELILRLINHRLYFFVNADVRWNLLDFVLVLFSLLDLVSSLLVGRDDESGSSNISYMRMLRLLKLAKILRTLRIMKVFRELGQMLESMRSCAISLFWSFVMILFVIFLFALIFLQGLSGYLREHDDVPELEQAEIHRCFGSFAAAMVSLFRAGTGGEDWGLYHELVKLAGPIYGVLFLVFIFFFVFALLSILSGVFVEKAVAAAQPDREEIILEQRRKTMVLAHEFRHLCKLLDADHTGTISRAEFMESMKNEFVASFMAAHGIDIRDVNIFFDMVHMQETDDDEVPIDRFVEGCMTLKGMATTFDVQRLTAHLHAVQKDTLRVLQEVKAVVKGITPECPHQSADPLRHPCDE